MPKWLLDRVKDQPWHGWSLMTVVNGQEKMVKPGISLHVGRTFYRKSIAVQVQAGGSIDVVAYCRSERHAQQLMAVLDMLILGDRTLLEGLDGESQSAIEAQNGV